VTVATDATVTIFYHTGWEAPRLLLANEEEDLWTEMLMGATGQGLWKRVSIPSQAGSGQKSAALKFVISNGQGSVDHPPSGSHYVCPVPGGYKLQSGVLTSFSHALEPSMVVSDLDGTMVGNGPDFDGGTAAFKTYWEDSAALSGSVLVYNTGRSIGQVVSLLEEEKQGFIAIPDVVITAVGTKIFDRKSSGKGVDLWDEDTAWSARLDEKWDLEVVREAAEKAISKNDTQCHWLDQGTEHPHRCSLSVNVGVLSSVKDDLQRAFDDADLRVKMIVSGVGEWRYLDCVASNAGKLEALEYVRRKHHIPKERCASCGDSGNDTLMLAGENPAIVVGNAQPDLRDWVLHQPQTGRIVQSDAIGARGILEGLARLHLY
ncbi:hypothetical protein CYMTET_14875, partial [Cymbomonas tetramitiformis]